MSRISLLTAILACMLAVTSPAALADDKGSKEFKKGQAFCPTQVLAVGNVIVQPGRCYVLAILRDSRGTFLAFVHPSAKIPANKRINLASDDGRKIRAKVIYLVPIQATGLSAVVVPVNTIQLVQIREEHRHDEEDDDEDHDGRKGQDQVVLIITGVPVPNLSVTFVIRF